MPTKCETNRLNRKVLHLVGPRAPRGLVGPRAWATRVLTPSACVPVRHRPDPDDGYSLLPLDVTDDLDPTASALYYACAMFIKSGDFDGAITYFDEVLAAAPGHPMAWRLLRKMKAEQARRLEIASLPSVQSRLLATLGARTLSLKEQAKMAREEARIEAKMAREKARIEAMLRKHGPAIDSLRKLGFRASREEVAALLIQAGARKFGPIEIIKEFLRMERSERDKINLARRNKAKMKRVACIDQQMKPLRDQVAAQLNQIAALEDQKAKLLATEISSP